METFNTRFFPVYRSLVSMMAWLPVFFLYFNEHLSIGDVLLLEAIYYSAVVLLEVPSGFFSDRFGRRKTLIISSIFFALSYAVFGFAEPAFLNFTLAQLALAVGMSFMSGSDTSFYYESLQEAGLEKEYADREARVQSYQQYTASIAVLAGGFLGALALKYAYVLSFVFMLPAVLICFMFREPQAEIRSHSVAQERRIPQVLSYLKIPELKWVFIYTVIIYVLSHITYEFYQPYLRLLDLEAMSLNTAISSGILFAVARLFGAFAAGRSAIWVRRFGIPKVFAVSLLLQLVIIGALAVVLHPLFVLLILFRSFSMAMTTAPINVVIAPRVKRRHRASYFSLQSLVSRLLYSFTLLVLSYTAASDAADDWTSLSNILMYSFIGGTIASIALLFINSGQLFERELPQTTNS